MAKVKERTVAHSRVGEEHRRGRELEWKTPRGRDIGEITRDATGQAIHNYREALEKLKKH
jgi:hypothetical protein